MFLTPPGTPAGTGGDGPDLGAFHDAFFFQELSSASWYSRVVFQVLRNKKRPAELSRRELLIPFRDRTLIFPTQFAPHEEAAYFLLFSSCAPVFPLPPTT
jgi:hypothetical protein